MSFLSNLLNALAAVSVIYNFNPVASQSIVCDDAYECANDTITEDYALCYGYYACSGASITSTYTYAWGAFAAYQADIDGSAVYSYGLYGSVSASIKAIYVYGYGYFGVMYADIQAYSDELTVTLSGYYAGAYADISCYSGDTCTVYCGSSFGCFATDFYCYSGATCFYDCDDDEDNCPTLYSGIGSQLESVSVVNKETFQHVEGLTDNEITEHYNNNKKVKLKLKKNKDHNAKMEDLLAKYSDEAVAAPIIDSPNRHHKLNEKFNYTNDVSYWITIGVAMVIGGLIVSLMSKSYNHCKTKSFVVETSEYAPLI